VYIWELRLSVDIKENFSGQDSSKCRPLTWRDGCEPMRFTDTNLRYNIYKCLHKANWDGYQMYILAVGLIQISYK
jgi:hypothetical protein